MQSIRPTGRLLSLDLFRGLTILLMVIVNSPDLTGAWHHAYWEGATIADWVFPWFLLIVGVSLAINETKLQQQRLQLGDMVLWRSIGKRALQLFALGLLVNLCYTGLSFELNQIRLLGVLQRIAIVYLVCALLLLYLPRKLILLLGIVLLLGYWALLSFVQFPGAVVGDLTRGNTVVNLFDQSYLPGKLWRGHWDPEGLLSTFPAIVTGISGLWVGWLLQGVTALPAAAAARRWWQLFVAGLLLLGLGLLWSLQLPLIKQLWTGSFVLVTSGLGCIVFVLLQQIQQRMEQLSLVSKLLCFLKVLGTNATVLYLWHVVLHTLLTTPLFSQWWQQYGAAAVDHATRSGLSFYQWLMQTLDGPGGIATVVYLLIFITLSVLPNFWLYQRRIFIKL